MKTITTTAAAVVAATAKITFIIYSRNEYCLLVLFVVSMHFCFVLFTMLVPTIVTCDILSICSFNWAVRVCYMGPFD